MTYDTRLTVELKKLVENAIESAKDRMAAGLVSSFEEYKQQVGILIGLRMSLDLLEEAFSIVNRQS